MDCIIGEINKSETTIILATKELPNDTSMEPVIQQKVKTETYDDNLHVHIKSEIHEMPTGSIKTETFDDCEDSLSCEASIVNDDEDDGKNDHDDDIVIDYIKDEIDIDETPIFKEEFSSGIPVTPVVQPAIPKANTVDEDVKNDDDDDENEVIDFIKDEIDIDETPIFKREFSSSIPDTPVQPVTPKPNTVDEDVKNDGDDDENEVGLIDFIKDEIDIDETPIFKREFSSSIPDIPVQPVIPKADRVNEDVENDLIDFIKDEIDIDETPIFKREFSSGIPDIPVWPVMPKSEPLESHISWETLQFYSNMELEICGRIAVVRLCRWEEDEHNLIVTKSEPSDCESEFQEKDYNNYRIGYTSRARRSSSYDDSSDDNHGPLEDGPAMKSLREYRMTRATPTSREQDTTIADAGSDCGNIKRRHIKTYICGKCKFMCHTKTSLEIHLKKHNGKERVCDICQYVALNIHIFKIHYRIHTGEKPYKCDVCNYKCAQKPHLVKHKRTHTGERPYGCTVCGSKFSDSRDLTRHMRIHTGEKPYGCTVCGSKFSDSGNLTKHMRIHTGEKPYSCKICNFKCSRSDNLREHVETHTRDPEDKKFSCDLCEFKTHIAHYLRQHKRIHTGVYYQCTECNYKSIYAADLSKHRKIHAGEKPYRCDTCGYRCIQFSHLKQHIRRHTGEKPYSCEQCDRKFTTSISLNYHRKLKHTVIKE